MSMYKQLLEEIFHAYPMYHKIGTAAYKEGLENIEALMAVLDHPERKLKVVHVAGTNGKGSTAHLIASYFQEQGLRTGLFTSPHLVDFRERIRIDGQMIKEQDVLDFFRLFKPKFDKLEPSFFEMTTSLAFWYFVQQKVDVAVIEVGLGGRLDATNVVTPLLSVITNITLEHTQLLGDSIAKIAFEKAGIIKQDVPVVVGEFHPESYPVFTDLAVKHNAPLFLADSNFTVVGDLSDCKVLDVMGEVLYEHVHLPLSGEYQRRNLCTFLQAVDVLQQVMPFDKDVTVDAIANVVNNTGFTGRWQVLRSEPLTICDVGHNVGGLSLTMRQLSEMPCRKLRIVFGMVSDKDVDHVLPLLPRSAKYYVCNAMIERAMPSDSLVDMMSSAGLDCLNCGGVERAFRMAQADAAPDDVLFVGGSCFVVGELLSAMSRG